MLLLLFAALWGAFGALLLCAPYSYYPLFILLFAGTIVIYFISRRFYKVRSKYVYPASILLLLLSYSLCTYFIFKPADFHYSKTGNIIKDKRAVIFYCEGEMEKYTPYYASYFFKDAPFLLKPFYAYNIKHIYKEIGVNTKNKELINVALEVKNSLLNYKPYYFYISFSGYIPDIKDSIHSAISDGCGEIIILNYSSNYSLEKNLEKKIDIESLRAQGVDIRFTKPVCSTDIFNELYISRVINMPFKWDGIFLLSEENTTANAVKAGLLNYGYNESQIYIGTDVDTAIDHFKNIQAKNIIYLNLQETSSGIRSDMVVPKEFERYGMDYKITGIKSWGYDKRLVKASIKVLLDVEKDIK